MPRLLTKADLQRAVIRTAVRANARHDATGLRHFLVEKRSGQDNRAWTSETERFAAMAWTRQFHSALSPAGPSDPAPPGAPAGATAPCPGLRTRGAQSPGGPGLSRLQRLVRGVVRYVQSFHNGEISHV